VPRAANLSVVFYLRLIFESSKELGSASHVEFDKDGCKVNNIVHGAILVEECREKNLYLFNVNV
jgi:hypothetical protein